MTFSIVFAFSYQIGFDNLDRLSNPNPSVVCLLRESLKIKFRRITFKMSSKTVVDDNLILFLFFFSEK